MPAERHQEDLASTAIRFAEPSDLDAYRFLRLAALQESPASFGSSYEREAAFPLATFASRLRPNGDPVNGIFGAFTAPGHLVGMLGFLREDRPKRLHVGNLWGMYVAPGLRGRGLGGALLDAALAHARGVAGVRQVTLSVTSASVAARALYGLRGFERYGLERDALCVDGSFVDEEHLILYLRGASAPVASMAGEPRL